MKEAPAKLDRIDLKILSALEQSGRITNQDLSAQVGLSASPCLHRVRRLEEIGLISGYQAKIEWTQIYKYVTIMAVLTLKDHGWRYLQEFERIIVKMPEVTHCYATCGECDYILHMTVSSIQRYQEMIDGLLDGPAGIEKVFSYVVMRQIKTRGSFPLELD